MSVIQQRIVFLNVILHVRWHHLSIINVEIEDLTWHVHDFIPHCQLSEEQLVSVTVEKICHCFLILFKGSEAISEAGRHLARAGLCLGKVATLSEDLLFVGVVCFHETIIGTGSGDFRAMVDTCPTGRAAASVSVTFLPKHVCIT